jgi:nucleoside-diphosphate-sugar epimerase
MTDERRRVLVTGAGGFIGGRVVEVLLETGWGEPVAAVRRWSTAVRIGRYPVTPIRCDLLDPATVRAAVEDIDLVVHCAVGDREATVQGTANLLSAAGEAGVRRVLHLSTVDVYGRGTGRLDESTPLVRTGRAYGDAKIEAEETCREWMTRGLDVVILRPSIVYGPFSDSWTLEFGQRLAGGSWLLPREACQGTCNLLHVDDLVRAVLLAAEAPDAPGRAFNVNGPDRPTWQEYVEALNAALGLPPLELPSPSTSRVRSTVVEPARTLVKATFHRFQEPILALYKRSRPARILMKGVESLLRRVPSPAEYDLYGRVVAFPTDEAERVLGYTPGIGMDEGVGMSAAWLLHEGVVPRAS